MHMYNYSIAHSSKIVAARILSAASSSKSTWDIVSPLHAFELSLGVAKFSVPLLKVGGSRGSLKTILKSSPIPQDSSRSPLIGPRVVGITKEASYMHPFDNMWNGLFQLSLNPGEGDTGDKLQMLLASDTLPDKDGVLMRLVEAVLKSLGGGDWRV